MPKIEKWGRFPAGVRQHLIDRVRDRKIGVADLNQLRHWIDSAPEVPEGDWFKDFGAFKLCERGSLSTTLLLAGQAAEPQKL